MTVLTIGTFDLPHYGHYRLFRRAAQLGDALIVGVNSDEFVTQYKGAPVMNEVERMMTLEAAGFDVILNEGPGHELIEFVKPAVLAIGSDWHVKDYLGQLGVTQDWIERRGITVAYVPYTSTISTTELRSRM